MIAITQRTEPSSRGTTRSPCQSAPPGTSETHWFTASAGCPQTTLGKATFLMDLQK